jgi:histidine triad (HIT) family protein
MKDGCVFCDYAGPSPVLEDYDAAFVIEPMNPVTPGHVLVIPREHVSNFAEDGFVSGTAMSYAWCYMTEAKVGPCNIITSVGREATQTIDHLHVHIVPRREGDGLALPWDAGNEGSTNG